MEQLIEGQFKKIGARAKVGVETKHPVTRAWNGRLIRPIQPQPTRVGIPTITQSGCPTGTRS